MPKPSTGQVLKKNTNILLMPTLAWNMGLCMDWVMVISRHIRGEGKDADGTLTLVGGAGALRTDAPDGECCGAGVLLEAVAAEAMDCRTPGEAIV